MKKVFLCAAAVAMLGLAACSNKAAENADTAALDSSALDTAVEVVEDVTVDSLNPESAQVTVTEAAAEVVEAPAAE